MIFLILAMMDQILTRYQLAQFSLVEMSLLTQDSI